MSAGGATDAPAPRVRRRHLLFFGGFDPKGASWYHAMYQRHAALQGAVNGMRIEVGPRRRDEAGRQHWEVRATDREGNDCTTRIEVIGWDAVVRRYWPRSAAGVLAQMLLAYGRMIRHGPGELLKVGQIAPRTLFALCYPLLFFLAGMLLSVAAALLLATLLAMLGLGPLPVAGTALIAFLAGLWAVMRLERKLDTSLLARILAFVADYAVQGVPELDALLESAAARIRELRRADDHEEVLVVGYSVGSILATRALGRVLAQEPDAAAGRSPALALLTLGHCIPLYGLFPQAQDYRTELARIARSDALLWVDVSSPADWGSFALLDPIEVCEVDALPRGRGSPQMTSPRFHTLIEPARYAAMVRDKHAIHTLYLQSTDKPGRYDWFAISAGAQPLVQRYAHTGAPRRAPTKGSSP